MFENNTGICPNCGLAYAFADTSPRRANFAKLLTDAINDAIDQLLDAAESIGSEGTLRLAKQLRISGR